MYGTVQVSLLFWKKLSGILKEWGFELNTYDRCVANQMVNWKQCTILWHVDGLKISHTDDKVLHADDKVTNNIINKLSKQFSKEKPLSITRGIIHTYLGMKIEFSDADKVMFTMYDYIKSMLEELHDK